LLENVKTLKDENEDFIKWFYKNNLMIIEKYITIILKLIINQNLESHWKVENDSSLDKPTLLKEKDL
jgi:hypothetical protein